MKRRSSRWRRANPTQEWIPPDIRKSKRHPPFSLQNSTLGIFRAFSLRSMAEDATEQEQKETGWIPMARLELLWRKHFSRSSVARLSRFLSRHFPKGAYRARFHCLPEQQTSQRRFGCPEKPRDHRPYYPHLDTLRREKYLYDHIIPYLVLA